MAWRDTPPPPATDTTGELQTLLEHYGLTPKPGVWEQQLLCPIHQENRPSMRVNLEKGVWWCHACGVGGGALQLIRAVEGGTFDDARRFAADLGIAAGSIESGDRTVRDRRDAFRGVGGVREAAWTSGGDGGFVPSWVRR